MALMLIKFLLHHCHHIPRAFIFLCNPSGVFGIKIMSFACSRLVIIDPGASQDNIVCIRMQNKVSKKEVPQDW
jgi:hypothetical protein